MLAKKVTALLVSAALAVCLLAGCGGKNQSLAQVILNLLDGQYTNVTVEIDPDLEAALRQAVRGAETEAEIRAALENILGPGISFQLLGDGQKGDTAWNLILYPGSDPDAAGRSGFVEWNKVFSALPNDGQYTARVAMIETDNGYALLVQATVDRAGSRDDDNDDDEPEEQIPESGYKKTDDTTYKVYNSTGLNNMLFDDSELTDARNSGFDGVTITLAANTTYTVSQQFTGNDGIFKGTLQGAGKESTTIALTGNGGLFRQIGVNDGDSNDNGKVENITFNVQENISEGYTIDDSHVWAGAVAGCNYGTIRNCDVNLTGKTITGTSAGGIAGYNWGGTITSCTVTGGTITGIPYAGGIAGYNRDGNVGSDGSCKVDGTSVTATSSNDNAHAGGLVGYSWQEKGMSVIVNGSYTGRGTIEATAEGDYGRAHAGGLVGFNDNTCTVDGSYSGDGTIEATAEGDYGRACAGGVVGYNNTTGTVNGSYSATGGTITAKVNEVPAKLNEADSQNGIGGSGPFPASGTAYAGTRIGFQDTGS